MNIHTIQRHVASAAAALVVSAIFIGTALAPVAIPASAPASAQQSVA